MSGKTPFKQGPLTPEQEKAFTRRGRVVVPYGSLELTPEAQAEWDAGMKEVRAMGSTDKIVHRAKWLNDKGEWRPLCRPRGPVVNYAKERSATEDKRVTCEKCLALLPPKIGTAG